MVRRDPKPLGHGFDGKSLYPFGTAEFVSGMEGREGSWNVDARTADLAAEGKEIAFPQVIPWFFHHKDLVVRDWIFRGYNDPIERHAAD